MLRREETSVFRAYAHTLAIGFALIAAWAAFAPRAHGITVAFEELSRIMDGQPPNNLGNLYARQGPANPASMFSGGGSENIPVVARTALYLWEDQPHRNWLLDYYAIQFNSGGPYFLNREAFSGVYTQAVVGAAMAVRQHATAQGHTGLVNRTQRFLRYYWTFLSLSAIDPNPTSTNTMTRCGNQNWSPANEGWGYHLGIVGRRTASPVSGNCATGFFHHGMQSQLLAMALQHPNRSIIGSLNRSPGFYGGPRAAVRAAGYTLSSGGTVNLQSMSVPATVFGLAEAQRTLLRNFIATNGRNGALPQVMALLDGQQISGNITIVKRSGPSGPQHARVTSWWGRWNAVLSPPGDAGGGPWFIVQARGANTETRYISRSTDSQGNPQGIMVWRDGQQICADANPPLPLVCVPLGESFDYEYRVLINQNGPSIQVNGPM